MSLGVIHNLRPKKRFHWGLISFEYNSKLIITSYKNIYSNPKGSKLCIKLYSSKSPKIKEINLNWDEISKKGSCNISVKDLFNEYSNEKGYYYFSLFSNYGGFFIYSTLEKKDSLTCEHSF